jgi:hypothetical protein
MPKVYEETRYWCEYCRIFIYNNRINREKHDKSPQHQANFKKRVENIRSEEKKREKLIPMTTTIASTKFNSVYTVSSVKQQESSTIPTHLLNIKTAAVAPKKQVLGLSLHSVKHTHKPSNDELYISTSKNDSSIFSVDVKAYASDLKRKIAEDELELHSSKREEQQTESTSQQPEVDLSSMFKKKKRANK